MNGAVLSFIKSNGGAGATALAVQMACASSDAVALLDLDIQFGCAAFQMDVVPRSSIIDLVATPERIDPAMVKRAMVRAHQRFDLLAAPSGVHPVDDVSVAGVLKVIDAARRVYDTILIDLPEIWTDWSHAALANSDHIIMVTRLSIPALRQARRQMEMLEQQGLGRIPLSLIANQVERSLFAKAPSKRDGEEILGRAIDFAIRDDPAMQLAGDSGLPLSEIRGGRSLVRTLGRIITKLRADGALPQAA